MKNRFPNVPKWRNAIHVYIWWAKEHIYYVKYFKGKS